MILSWLTLFLATHPSSLVLVLIWIRNRKACSSSSSVRTGTSLHGNLLTCQVYQGNSLSTLSILIQSLNRSSNSFVVSMKRGARPLVKKWAGSWQLGLLWKFFILSGCLTRCWYSRRTVLGGCVWIAQTLTRHVRRILLLS